MSNSTFAELAIIVPFVNEERTIGALLTDLVRCFPGAEIIAVDNNSTDSSVVEAEAIPKIIVTQEGWQGKANAMRKGVEVSTRSVILFVDADLEYRVDDMPDIALSVLNDADRDGVMAIGVRAWQLNWLPVISFGVNWLVRAIIKTRYGTSPDDCLTAVRCLTKATIYEMNTLSPNFSIETEISRLSVAMGLRIKSSMIRYTPRTYEEGKKIRWRHLMPIINEAFSSRLPYSTHKEGAVTRASCDV